MHHRPAMRTDRLRSAAQQGFTLVELLIVVAIVGVLAALGFAGFQKYVRQAATSEAAAVISGIRTAEENYKAETLTYLGCSGCGATGCFTGNLGVLYPQNGAPNKAKWAWSNSGHPDYLCWRMLNVQNDGPVLFGYAVVAGAAGQAVGSPGPAGYGLSDPGWPNPPADPWYVVQGKGDQNGDGRFSYFAGSSFSNEIFAKDETE